jgi:nucleotide-binding universal stress UspA family protein
MGPIVVGYSGSDQATRALLRAASLAQAPSSLIVVAVARSSERIGDATEQHVGPGPVAGLIPPSPTSSGREEEGESEELRIRHLLDRARELLADQAGSVEFVAEVGSPADRLLAVATERNSDLIVIGSREHGVLERLWHPHAVEEKISARFDRDVLLVH